MAISSVYLATSGTAWAMISMGSDRYCPDVRKHILSPGSSSSSCPDWYAGIRRFARRNPWHARVHGKRCCCFFLSSHSTPLVAPNDVSAQCTPVCWRSRTVITSRGGVTAIRWFSRRTAAGEEMGKGERDWPPPGLARNWGRICQLHHLISSTSITCKSKCRARNPSGWGIFRGGFFTIFQ